MQDKVYISIVLGKLLVLWEASDLAAEVRKKMIPPYLP